MNFYNFSGQTNWRKFPVQVSKKLRKKENRIKAAEDKILRTYRGFSHYCKRRIIYEARSIRDAIEDALFAKPDHDSLVRRIRDHKEEVKGFRR